MFSSPIHKLDGRHTRDQEALRDAAAPERLRHSSESERLSR